MTRILVVVILSATVVAESAGAADRVTVIAPPAGQEAAEALVESLEGACNRGDFIGFIGHFTPTHGRRI
jgi:hypothetical protein